MAIIPVYVPDASFVVDAVLGQTVVLDGDEVLAAPNLLPLEVLQTLRALLRRSSISAPEADRGVERLRGLRVRYYPENVFTEAIWDLRHNVSVYDAAYVALASLLGATLLTRDQRLARAVGTRIPVKMV